MEYIHKQWSPLYRPTFNERVELETLIQDEEHRLAAYEIRYKIARRMPNTWLRQHDVLEEPLYSPEWSPPSWNELAKQ